MEVRMGDALLEWTTALTAFLAGWRKQSVKIRTQQELREVTESNEQLTCFIRGPNTLNENRLLAVCTTCHESESESYDQDQELTFCSFRGM